MRTTSVRSRPLNALLAAITLPVPAHAHLVTTGLGPFYDGITHFFVSLEDLLPALALALLAGLQGARAGRYALFCLTIAWFVAGVAAMLRPTEITTPALAAFVLLGFGALAAADRRVPDALVGALAVLLGTVGGYLSASAIAVEADLTGFAVLGAAAALFAVVALAAAAAVVAQRAPGRIVARVAASWLAAIGLLRLGWWLGNGG
jgi:urease accessory protein